MNPQLKNPKLYLMLVSDAVLFALALCGAYLLRFELVLRHPEIMQLGAVLIWLVPMKLVVFFAFGLYRGMWRYTSVRDFWHLAQASLVSMFLTMAVILFLYRFQGFSRAVVMLDGLLTFLFTGALRMGIRSYFSFKDQNRSDHVFSGAGKKRKKVLIVGAGKAGEKILREIFDNYQLFYEVEGFVDDDSQKQGRSMHGVPVLGSIQALPRLIGNTGVGEVLIAIPSATGDQMRRIVDICKECDVPYKTLPGIGEIIDGRASVKILRDVSYQDLLGRPPVRLDVTGIREYIDGRTVLITGCGGSIGSELCRQVVRFQPRSVVLLDASEANLFQIEMELQHEMYYRSHHAILGQVQDRSLMEAVFRKYHPQVVFHAAAYKHVPMLEKNPWEAVSNNVEGSRVAMEVALEHKVERFVLVSTDKAVRPTNVMGASKRITEIMLQSFQGKGTRFMAVRFGNVIGSSGSVMPLFRRQIELGGPVTVTHPEVTRYFMTIPEAAQLIIQAGAMGRGGDIFVLEMGTPVRIADMARDLIRLSGKEPDKDIRIVFTGLREGEKLHEELIAGGESIAQTEHEKIMVLNSNGGINGTKDPASLKDWLKPHLERLSAAAAHHDALAVKMKMRDIAPEYTPQETDYVL
jgi:FlaA1/EpsC-like NDP-sugar epimerase